MEEQTKGWKVVASITDVADIIGTLVPTIGAIGSMVRLLATTLRPTHAQQAQAFDAAIAAFDAAKDGLDTAVAGFEQAKAQAAAHPEDRDGIAPRHPTGSSGE